MDERFLEVASQLEEQHRAEAISRNSALKPETHPDFDGVHCVDCDDAIPPERLAMKKVYCTYCAEIRQTGRR